MTFDDARHYSMTSTEKFHHRIRPLELFIKGTAALYSREYFEAACGISTLAVTSPCVCPFWYETDEITFRREPAMFFDAFLVWNAV